MAIWISKALAANKTITGEIIIVKAINFANLLNIEGFTGSFDWLSNFKKRYNIKQYNKHGEAQSRPSEEELDKGHCWSYLLPPLASTMTWYHPLRGVTQTPLSYPG